MKNDFLQSLRKNKIGILLMIVSSICACVGQLFWKLSASQGFLVMLIGFLFYGIGALVMLVAYKFGSLSVLQPMLSLNYAISIVLSAIFLHESVTIFKVVGVIVIMCGVALIAGGDSE
jgi:uncharacterized membrane protein